MIIQDLATKRDIGPVESGDIMKLFEFTNKEVNDDLPFDVVDDVHFHMIDDDAFYRKHYLPCMSKVKSVDSQQDVEKHIQPMIKKCLNHYCLKYDLNKTPEELLDTDGQSQLVQRILDYERTPDKDILDAPTSDI